MDLLSLFVFLSVGVILVIVGMIFHAAPPSNINGLYGYRTPRSMRDQASWDLAQAHSAKLMIYAGIAASGIGLAAWYTDPDLLFGCVVMIFQLLTVVPVILSTESKLKKIQRR